MKSSASPCGRSRSSFRIRRKTVSRIATGEERPKKPQKPVVLAPYLRLIDEWYARRPSLKATL